MAKVPPDAFREIRARAKESRRHAKQILDLIKIVEGAAASRALGDDADALNLEFAVNGEVLFAFDVGDLPELRQDVAALLGRIEVEATTALRTLSEDLA